MKNVLTLVLGGGQGTRLYPLDQVPLEAGRAGGRQVPADRHSPVELHQQRSEPLLRANAVQLGQPAPPHPLDLHLRPLRRRLRRGAGRAADPRQRQLVPGHGRRRAAEPPLRRAARHRVRADPLRRPIVPDELSGHDPVAHRIRGRRDDRRRAGAASEAASAWASCGWTTTGRVVGFLEKPKTAAGTSSTSAPIRAWIDARGIASRGRDCLANMGIYLFNRNALIDVLRKTDYRDFGKEVFPASIRSAARAGPPVRRLLGRHRHDQVVLPGQPGPGRSRTRRSTWLRPSRRSTRTPASCRRRESTGPRSAAAWWPTAR